jgi:hypothetical protein
VTVTIRVSPSIQTQGLYPNGTANPRIWTDGEDLVCAEYRVEVQPSWQAQWVITQIDEVMVNPGAAQLTPY